MYGHQQVRTRTASSRPSVSPEQALQLVSALVNTESPRSGHDAEISVMLFKLLRLSARCTSPEASDYTFRQDLATQGPDYSNNVAPRETALEVLSQSNADNEADLYTPSVDECTAHSINHRNGYLLFRSAYLANVKSILQHTSRSGWMDLSSVTQQLWQRLSVESKMCWKQKACELFETRRIRSSRNKTVRMRTRKLFRRAVVANGNEEKADGTPTQRVEEAGEGEFLPAT